MCEMIHISMKTSMTFGLMISRSMQEVMLPGPRRKNNMRNGTNVAKLKCENCYARMNSNNRGEMM